MALDTNLVSYWKLDESSGNASDSVGGNTLTNTDVTYGAAKLNNGAISDSTGDYLTITDGSQSGLDITGALTLSCWVKLGSLVDSSKQIGLIRKYTAAGNQRSYQLILANNDGSQDLFFSITPDGSTSTDTLYDWSPSTDTWYHVAAVYTPSTSVKIYIDGNLVVTNTTSIPAAIYSSSADFFLLQKTCIGTQSIDEVGIWSRALTADEVSQLYNSNRALAYPLTAPTLYGGVAYYKLDDVNDSIQSYTLTNAGTTTFATGKIGNAADFGASNSTKYLHRNDTYGLTYVSLRSFSFWVNITTAPANGSAYIISRLLFDANPGNYTSIGYRQQAGVFELLLNTTPTTYTVTQTLTPGTWYHIVVTHDGTGTTNAIKIYLNGNTTPVLQGDSWTSDLTAATQTNLVIGAAHDYSDKLSGLVDEFAVFNRVLTTTEITALYNSGAGLQYPFLQYPFTGSLSAGNFFSIL